MNESINLLAEALCHQIACIFITKLASTVAQLNSEYVSVYYNPIRHGDGISKSLRHFLLAPVFHRQCYAFSCALSSYGAHGKFEEHSRR